MSMEISRRLRTNEFNLLKSGTKTHYPFSSSKKIEGNLFVHCDGDIFSATLFALLEIDKLKIPYYAVFDEFKGHETHALHRYMQMSGAEIELIASTGNKRYPMQVSCVIKPVREFDV